MTKSILLRLSQKKKKFDKIAILISKSFRKISISNIHQLLGVCHIPDITFIQPSEFGPFQNSE